MHSATDMLDGITSVFITILFCAVGIYANRLSFRLFVHPKFLANLRLHSKTIMKINAAFILLVIMAGFFVVQNVSLVRYFYLFDPSWNATAAYLNATATKTTVDDSVITTPTTITEEESAIEKKEDLEESINPCQVIQIPVVICQTFYFFQLIFSLFFMVWNVLVAVVLISISRTHTIQIRTFMRELIYDAHLHDKKFRKNFYAPTSAGFNDTLKEYTWVDNDQVGIELRDGGKQKTDAIEEGSHSSSSSTQQPTFNNVQLELNDNDDAERKEDVKIKANRIKKRFGAGIGTFHRLENAKRRNQCDNKQDNRIENLEEVTQFVPHIMSEQEIMHKYWKLCVSSFNIH